ncbi:hypothetical protein CRG98_000559 [Punica granatum]|uniref:CCHC-type domain-containing protein n=1 Tax=Punica granatum TaxID=22663 RepID=A0A2I0LEH1_PUNGR|nr:hypothetical protein CRG98_000559 [Punica granatum]
MDPLPSVNRAHSMAAHDEAQHLIAQGRDSDSDVMGFVAKMAIDSGVVNLNFSRVGNPNFNPNQGDFKPRARPICDFCGRNGHHRATCYQLHGYPNSDQANQCGARGNSSEQSRPGGKVGSSSPSVSQIRGGGNYGFGSSHSVLSGNHYSGGPFQTRSAQ